MKDIEQEINSLKDRVERLESMIDYLQESEKRLLGILYFTFGIEEEEDTH